MSAKRLCVCLMAVACLLLLSLSFVGSAEEAPLLEEHYEKPNDLHVTVYDAPTLYRLVFEEEPTGELLEYLTYMSISRFFVSDPTMSHAHATYQNGILSVEASAYSYTAQNGANVTFLPETVKIGGKALSFESEDGIHYFAQNECSEEDADTECLVTYQTSLTVSDAVLADLLNGAFDCGSKLRAEQTAYDKALADYKTAYADYQAYTEAKTRYGEDWVRYEENRDAIECYERAVLAYENYVKKKEAYDVALAKYNTYSAEKAVYDIKYGEYQAYSVALVEYQSAWLLWRQSQEQRTIEKNKLYAIDSAYVDGVDGGMLYATIIGDTVASVVSAKKDIEKAIGNYDGLPEAIDAADIATKNLQTMLSEYRAFHLIKEKYAYYAAHYEEFCDNFSSLYSSLKKLFDNNIVQMKLKTEGRYERYKEFLAQLFIMSASLDDSVTLDSSVVIADGDRIKDLISDDRLIKDTNRAKPSFDTLPAQKAEPTAPEEVEHPGDAPKAVAHPGDAPKAVDHPGERPTEIPEPTPPAAVAMPTPPVPLQMTALEARLCEAVKSGRLTEQAYHDDASFSLSCTVGVIASVPERVTVAYYDSDRKTLLYMTRVEEGEEVCYKGKTPSKEADLYARYEFVGFFDESGNRVEDGTVLAADTYLYAQYREIPMTYTVTFSVDGVLYTSTYVYGQMPNPPTATEKASDERYHYVFNGWTPAVSYVTEDTVYEATYRQIERTYQISFVAKGTVLMQTELAYGAMPAFHGVQPKQEVTDSYIESFTGWTPALAAVTGDTVYTAVYQRVTYGYDSQGETLTAIMKDNNTLEIANTTATFNSGNLFEYAAKSHTDIRLLFPSGEVLITGEDAQTLAEANTVSVTLTGSGANRTFRVLSKNSLTTLNASFDVTLDVSDYVRDDTAFRIYDRTTNQPLFFTLKDGKASLTLQDSTQLLLVHEYDIDLAQNQGGTLDADREVAADGEMVTLSVQSLYGYFLESLTVTTVADDELVLEGMTFKMPNASVKVKAEFSPRTYVLRYLDADGALLLEKTLTFFEEEPIIDDPVGEEMRLFDGWIKSGSAEDGSVTYTARYRDAVYADPDKSYQRDYGGWLLRDYIPHTIAVACGLCALAVLLYVCKKSRKKKKAKNKNNQAKK